MTIKDNKLYNDKGEVAVAVSTGYGAGWSTWNPISATDARFNILILEDKWDEAEALAKESVRIYNRNS